MEGWATVPDLSTAGGGWTRARVLDANDLLDAIAEVQAKPPKSG